MAVIKIVPMPGAEGQRGEEGAVGPQGPQGIPGPQGEPGINGSFVYHNSGVPLTHHGVAGDLKNDIRYDSTHMYICVENYTDGNAIIWKRINWASGNW